MIRVLRFGVGLFSSFLLSSTLALAAPSPKTFVTDITDAPSFDVFADAPGGVVRTGKVIKFLIDNRKYPAQPALYFINGNYCTPADQGKCPSEFVRLHRTFAAKTLANYTETAEEFNSVAYFPKEIAKRRYFAGRIQTFEIAQPDGTMKLFYGVWFIERDTIAEETLQYAMDLISKHFVIPGAELAFVTYSQQQTTERVKDWFASKNIPIYSINKIMENVKYLYLNGGETYGRLVFYPKDSDDLEVNDIPVFDELPLDLAVVAGVVTTTPQDVASHINLKSKERLTPNSVIRDAAEVSRMRTLDGKYVHYVVKPAGYTLEETTEAEFKKHLATKPKRKPLAIINDLSGVQVPVMFDSMCAGAGRSAGCLKLGARFGGKASRLGFLAHPEVIGEGSVAQKKLGYRLTPMGFGIPLGSYKQFMEYNRQINPSLAADLDLLIQTEKNESGTLPLPTAEKKALIARIQQAIRNGSFAPGTYEIAHAAALELKKRVDAKYGEDLNTLKIRSSANIEDMENFNGAGLHDSYSGKLKLSNIAEANQPCTVITAADGDAETKTEMSPETFACAIKGVYASLWNLRAVRERSYAGYDHAQTYMALAVHPSYKFRKNANPPANKIFSNSVIVTRVLNAPHTFGYQISTQAGDNLVTNPTPGTHAEYATMTFLLNQGEPAMSVIRYAQPKKGEPEYTQSVLAESQMKSLVYLARTVEEAYCTAKPEYFPGRRCREVSNSQKKPKSLDMEVKVLLNGNVHFKQVREFSGK